MKQLCLASIVLLCGAAFAEIPEDLQMPPIPGVDLCALFEVEEIAELTGMEITGEFDHAIVPGYYHGTVFYPDGRGFLSDVVPEPTTPGRKGYGGDPFNGRRCIYKGPAVQVNFFAYESQQEVVETFSTSRFEEIAPTIFAHEGWCFVVLGGEPAPWVSIQVGTLDLTKAEQREISCRIATEANLGLRSVGARADAEDATP